eukprot:TRINITY_DN32037_c0_g1_i1.p1 TRINITY_DN32037_c0_g1~~TRINITY_DN32037_c0_g1_i1.p1  ORF type:complete len:185 (-),score=7.78 TRINITY_DN32037_c0_g1_i1:282-836(-)
MPANRVSGFVCVVTVAVALCAGQDVPDRINQRDTSFGAWPGSWTDEQQRAAQTLLGRWTGGLRVWQNTFEFSQHEGNLSAWDFNYGWGVASLTPVHNQTFDGLVVYKSGVPPMPKRVFHFELQDKGTTLSKTWTFTATGKQGGPLYYHKCGKPGLPRCVCHGFLRCQPLHIQAEQQLSSSMVLV